MTEDIRIPTASLNGDLDYEDEDEESAKSSLTNGGVIQVHLHEKKKMYGLGTLLSDNLSLLVHVLINKMTLSGGIERTQEECQFCDDRAEELHFCRQHFQSVKRCYNKRVGANSK